MTAPTALHSAVDEILPGLVADRRHLHEHPELGMQEVETSRFVAERLAQLGVEDIRTGIANTGVTGLIRGTNPDGAGAGKVILLRADMDALPMEEENDVEYRSQNAGVMHACGHDAHTAMLMGTARVLMGMRDQFAGAVKLLFQPCEERPPGGARFMIEQGVMENPTVTGAFAIHMANSLPVGIVGTRAGAQQAAADLFTITVQGKGGHGAAPHETVDPVVVGSQIVMALQTLVSRETDPLASVVVTVGTFNAGSAPNIIPDTASMHGTVRTLDQSIRERTAERMKTLVEGVATSLGASAKLDYEWGYPALVNDAGMAQLVLETAREVVGPERTMVIPPSMPGEDMSYFLQEGARVHVRRRLDEQGQGFRLGPPPPEVRHRRGQHGDRRRDDDQRRSGVLPAGLTVRAPSPGLKLPGSKARDRRLVAGERPHGDWRQPSRLADQPGVFGPRDSCPISRHSARVMTYSTSPSSAPGNGSSHSRWKRRTNRSPAFSITRRDPALTAMVWAKIDPTVASANPAATSVRAPSVA